MARKRGRRKRSLRSFYRRGRGRPLRSPELALEVFHLKENGLSEAEIADRFGWAKQNGPYENQEGKFSRTVRRYIERAREIMCQRREFPGRNL